MQNLRIVGLGGVGSELSEKISKFLNYCEGEDFLISLVDGDEYELKNKNRQEFSNFGRKAEIKREELRKKYPMITYESLPIYVNESNVKDIIKENDTVFLGVDNHKTRKVISDYVKGLSDVVLISGGNELTDGNVQIHIRKGGTDVTPSLTDYHPEIDNPSDKSPDEMSCEELHSSSPQLLFTNVGVSTLMCWAYYNIKKGNNVPSEIYFDIGMMKVDPKERKLKKKVNN